jgi:hypothetical protein
VETDDGERRKRETAAVLLFVILNPEPGGNGLAFDPITRPHMKRGKFVSDGQKRNEIN